MFLNILKYTKSNRAIQLARQRKAPEFCIWWRIPKICVILLAMANLDK